MSQPVVDTLELCDALRKTGMQPDQAEGLARALGRELGTHLVAQGDMQAGFQQVRSEIQAACQEVRSDLQAEIRAVDHKVDLARSELGGRIESLDRKIEGVDSKLTFMVAGFGLLLAVLTVAGGMGLFERAPTPPPSAIEVAPASL